MRIKDNHIIVESGVVFTYHKKEMSISWRIADSNLEQFWSVSENIGGEKISRVRTEIDMQIEIMWFLYKNQELVPFGKSKNRRI